MITEPMKAPREILLPKDFATLQFPVFASLKADGVRCLTHPDLGPVSRSFKPIPNDYIRNALTDIGRTHLDGEIVVLDRNGRHLPFNDCQSAVMRRAGQPAFQYQTFDCFYRPSFPFTSRLADLRKACPFTRLDGGEIIRLDQIWCETAEFLYGFYSHAVHVLGAEGIVVRSPSGVYKCGRCTEREGIMYKSVEFMREEAWIVGFEEEKHNCNVAKSDEFGRTKRSKHKAGMVGTGRLGAFVVESPKYGQFNVSGFTREQAEGFWEMRHALVADKECIVYKYKPHGTKDVPRHPVFVGFRDEEDL